MKDESYWKLADCYEQLNKNGKPYIPKNQFIPLTVDTIAENDKDYDETIADLGLFNYGPELSNKIPDVCIDWAKHLCKKERI